MVNSPPQRKWWKLHHLDATIETSQVGWWSGGITTTCALNLVASSTSDLIHHSPCLQYKNQVFLLKIFFNLRTCFHRIYHQGLCYFCLRILPLAGQFRPKCISWRRLSWDEVRNFNPGLCVGVSIPIIWAISAASQSTHWQEVGVRSQGQESHPHIPVWDTDILTTRLSTSDFSLPFIPTPRNWMYISHICFSARNYPFLLKRVIITAT